MKSREKLQIWDAHPESDHGDRFGCFFMMNLSADQLVLYLNSPKALNSLNLPNSLNSSNLPQLIQLTSTHLAQPTYPIHPNSPQLIPIHPN